MKTQLSDREIAKLVAEVAQSANIRARILLSKDPAKGIGGGMMFGPFGDIPMLNFSPEAIADFTPEELRGVIAHELGHIVLGHGYLERAPFRTREENWKIEFSADDFAVKNGLRQELIAGLQKSLGSKRLKNRDSHSHPSLSRRIARLQEAPA